MKILWLILAIFTGALGIYNLIIRGFESAYMFLIMALLSLTLFYIRYKLDKKVKKHN
ncbi:MAG: hypothetical protein JW894_00530 [Bacteroidales bacterium]|nr:hypothetical protein [Bacteroidales bacterium]